MNKRSARGFQCFLFLTPPQPPTWLNIHTCFHNRHPIQIIDHMARCAMGGGRMGEGPGEENPDNVTSSKEKLPDL